MRALSGIIFVLMLGVLSRAEESRSVSKTATAAEINIADLRLRDPFVFTDVPNSRYILLAKFDRDGHTGWHCFTSKDLQHWQMPVVVYVPPAGAAADHDYWAPEMHAFGGKFYIFGTVRGEHVMRGTQIFVGDNPLGPYRPVSDRPATPADWLALDGTLHVEQGEPWMIFCHEWLQTNDGTMNAIRLSPDLSKTISEPIQLFRASEAPWCRPIKPGMYVTDGPWVYHTAKGKLLLLWSSNSVNGYCVGIARSTSGTIQGPWTQDAKPLYEGGGHCMTFRTLEGKPMLLLHGPNKMPNERARFFDIHEEGDELRVVPVEWQKAK